MPHRIADHALSQTLWPPASRMAKAVVLQVGHHENECRGWLTFCDRRDHFAGLRQRGTASAIGLGRDERNEA